MGRSLDRNQSTAQLSKHCGVGCIWGFLPLHFHSFKNFLPSTRHKHEEHSKYYQKTHPREPGNGEEDESLNQNYACNDSVCLREHTIHHSSREGSLSGVKVIAQPFLQRTKGLRHLEPMSEYTDDFNIDLKHPASETIVSESKHMTDQQQAKSDHEDDEGNKLRRKSFENFFDAFKIDGKLFMMNTRKSDANARERVVESRKKLILKRSGSYPTANKSRSRYGNLTPSKLEDKLNEVWPSGSFTASPLSSSSPSSSTTTTCSSSPSSLQCENVELLHSYSTQRKVPMDGPGGGSYRRATSLNDSLVRYTQLFETSFRRDAMFNPSKSQMLSNENGVDDCNPYDLNSLRKARSMRESLQVDHSDIIEYPELLNKSESQRTESLSPEQSDFKDAEDESGTADMQNAANTLPGDIHHENILRTKKIVDLTDLTNSLKQLVGLSTMRDPPGLYDDLEDLVQSDLVNELIYDASEECDAYYWPTSLCSYCHVHPHPPTEDHVSNKILSRIQKIQGCILNASSTVKSIAAYDLSNSSVWMNLQVDAESLGIALEEMFFNELLEELICE